ncbi:hypothetical protein H072_11310 [Dactylellina haptotyla CBS 200.50]|uniref:L-ornithine N(5)-oxygenase n=1 Tax=Dactylellina haptotyla (strain CBS 200.50) TaxID=1284197 RepID=S7ZX97_DACHA|nr:hypothetical protein H072_11310 [Dactylellina haptotyla CBS 200.50]
MYSTVLIVGAGESGLCMGVQLKTKFNLTDFVIYERNSDIGGTWYVNTYPGVACDVPALCYSFSFATNPDWSTSYPHGPELHAYLTKVCEDYKLRPHITFNTEVESATYDEKREIWSVRLRRRAVAEWELNLGDKYIKKTITTTGEVGDTWTHECKLFFTAVGGLIEPADINMKGMENFKGPIFHSAFWDHTVDINDKNVVLVGNGCTAAQIVPAIEPKVKSLTQIVRSSHWMLPRPSFPGVSTENYEKWSPTVFRYLPGSQLVARYLVFAGIESAWLAFRNTPLGEKLRAATERKSIKHVKAKAPEEYWDLLIPKFPIGFKRRIFDDTYLPSLGSPKVHLTKDDITHLSEDAVHTATGAEYKADVVIMATGFKTNEWIAPLKIIGRKGEDLSEHWRKMGGPAAYNATAMNGFPNCFLIVGPNSITGHTSVILATENMCRYALNIAAPVLKGDASEVEIKREAEVDYSKWMQEAMTRTVFSNREFKSWYVREDGWNSSTYPRSQLHFMYRSYFPVYKDWVIKKTSQGIWKSRIRRILVLFLIFGAGATNFFLRKRGLTFRDMATLGASILVSSLENVTGTLKATLQ